MRTKRVISIWSLPIFRLKYLTQSTTSKKLCFVWIQVWMLVYKLLLVEMTQKFPLRQENHAFVKVCLANFWCAIWRKIFQRDSIFVYFSTLCALIVIETMIWRKNVDFSVKIMFAFYRTFPHYTVNSLHTQSISRYFLKSIMQCADVQCTARVWHLVLQILLKSYLFSKGTTWL